jgi:hypothetical protein
MIDAEVVAKYKPTKTLDDAALQALFTQMIAEAAAKRK